VIIASPLASVNAELAFAKTAQPQALKPFGWS